MLKDEDEFVKVDAAIVLGNIADEYVIAELENVKQSVHPVRQIFFDRAIFKIKERKKGKGGS